MLITFTGRKSHRVFTTPVRYVRAGGTVRCFTSSENLWWRNLRGGADVVLRLKGQEKRYHAMVIENDPDTVRVALEHYLGIFPQDAAYHEIQLNPDKSLVSEDLERASKNAVVVEARLIYRHPGKPNYLPSSFRKSAGEVRIVSTERILSAPGNSGDWQTVGIY